MKLLQFIQKIERNVLGINERNASLIYPNNPRKSFFLADDKIITKSILKKHGIPHSPTYTVIERIGDIKNGWDKIQKYSEIAVKPARGRGGGGIKIYKKNSEGQWINGGEPQSISQIFNHMANILMGVYSFGDTDRVLIEKCIKPHTFFAEIYPVGVPDFRIILYNNVPFMAMLRVPTHKSEGKANLHQGGIGIGVDMTNGTLTAGFDGKKHHDNHPDSNGKITGKKIPYWNDIIDIAIKTSTAFPLNYLGIDIVIDKNDGPLILEINVRPGLAIQSVNKTGIKQILKNIKL